MDATINPGPYAISIRTCADGAHCGEQVRVYNHSPKCAALQIRGERTLASGSKGEYMIAHVVLNATHIDRLIAQLRAAKAAM